MEFLHDTLTVTGAALRGGEVTVEELARLAEEKSLAYTGDYTLVTGGGKARTTTLTGIPLPALLKLFGLSPEAADETPVTALFKDGLRLKLTLGQLRRAEKPVLIAWAAGGLPLIGPTGREPLYKVFTEADGLSRAAGNSGGPLRLAAEGLDEGSNAPGCGKWLSLLAAGDFAEAPRRLTDEEDPGDLPAPTGPPAGEGAALTLRLYGREETISWTDLRALPRLRAWFAARDGRFAFEGVPLRALLKSVLRPGETVPAELWVSSPGGYGHAVEGDWVQNGVESRYQPGERREVLLAWAQGGAPLPPGDGPLRLVVENEIACWIRGVNEISNK